MYSFSVTFWVTVTVRVKFRLAIGLGLVIGLVLALGLGWHDKAVKHQYNIDTKAWTTVHIMLDKNSSGDEIANVNFYAVRPEASRIRWNNTK